MRKILNLLENIMDDEEPTFDHLPSIDIAKMLKPEMVLAAQKIYDDWIQDEDDDLNGGGICHLIADAICGIVADHDVFISTVTATDVQHVYCVGQFKEGIFEIDIPYRIYEHGGGFTWTKIEGVTFSIHDIFIEMLDSNPANMKVYVDEW